QSRRWCGEVPGRAWEPGSSLTSEMLITWQVLPSQQHLLQALADRFNLDAANNVVGEGKGQKSPGRFQANATRAQIEQSLIGKLADGGSVRALDVVGVDFELRLGVDLGIVRQEQCFVGLLGIGLLSVLRHANLAVEYASGLPIKHALVELVARAM